MSDSCLSVVVTCTHTNISPLITKVNEGLICKVRRLNELLAKCFIRGERISIDVKCTHKPLNVKCNIVCTLKEVINRLSVTPSDIQWITPDYGIMYEVESNTDWIIIVD